MNRKWIRIGALAAAALAIAGAGCGGKTVAENVEPVFIPRDKEAVPAPPPPATAPEKEEMTSQGYVKLDYPAPGFRGAPVRFTWYRFPEAGAYQVVIMAMTEAVVFEGPKRGENLLDLMPAWSGALDEGNIYFWQVTAFNEEGTPIGRSPLRDFVYTP
ncbi:MAG: hypothetical protein ABIK65_06455 [Candidatus Eisenbacteria bacterium]